MKKSNRVSTPKIQRWSFLKERILKTEKENKLLTRKS